MSDTAYVRRLRNALRKKGYLLLKSRAKNWSYQNQLGYMIVDAEINACVSGSNFDCSLADVARFVEIFCNE